MVNCYELRMDYPLTIKKGYFYQQCKSLDEALDIEYSCLYGFPEQLSLYIAVISPFTI